MHRIVRVQKAAQDQSSNYTKEQIAKQVYPVDSSANTGRHEFLSTSANEIFTGTDGVEDVFRFHLWKNNGIDTIRNFDVGEDKLILEWSAVNGLHASHVSSNNVTGTITAYEYGGTGPNPTTEIHVSNLRAINDSHSLSIKFIRPDLVLDV